MTAVVARFDAVRARMAAAGARSGIRTVRLVAISKLHPVDVIQEAHRTTGHDDFGENYAQELREKAVVMPDLTWHAVGPLQRKNAKYVAAVATYFHALDDLRIAGELSRRRVGDALRCFIQVNVAGETTKAGVAPTEVRTLTAAVGSLPNLLVVGLSIMPPLTDNPEDSRPYFRALATLAREVGLAELSMGTTSDFEVAIEEGATMVRVGTALFGERPTSSADPSNIVR